MTTGRLHGDLFCDTDMATIFDDAATLQGMLDFEAALAHDEAAEGIIPHAAAEIIAAACLAGNFDIAEIGRAALQAGNPAVPMVRLLAARVAETDTEAARWVHWGATSQDAIDTGRLVQIAGGLRLVEQRLERLAAILARLADQHRATIMPGRSALQHAAPVTFGLKAAYWLDAIIGHDAALTRLLPSAPLQLGGATGTLASLGPRGAELQERMTGSAIAVPWHTTRQAQARLGAELGLLAGTLGKIGRDITLLMQTEVAEVSETPAPDVAGAAAPTHRRTPVQSVALVAIATRTPGLVSTLLACLPQEHERAAGGWHAEWDTVPQLFLLVGAALNHAIALLDTLEVDAARMRANLELSGGLFLSKRLTQALAEKMPRGEAQAIVDASCRTAFGAHCPLCDVLAADPRVTAHLDAEALAALFDPATYLGATNSVVERVLALYSLHFSH